MQESGATCVYLKPNNLAVAKLLDLFSCHTFICVYFMLDKNATTYLMFTPTSQLPVVSYYCCISHEILQMNHSLVWKQYHSSAKINISTNKQINDDHGLAT